MWVCVCLSLWSPPTLCDVCIGSIVTMCVLSLHSSVYFRGNDLTNRSTADVISGSLFSCRFPEELSVTVKHLEGLSRPESPQWVVCTYRMYTHMRVLQHNAYRSCETYFSHPRWFTLLVFTDEWITHTLPRLIQGSYLRVLTHTPSPTDGYNQPLVYLPSMKHHILLYMTHLLPVAVHSLHVNTTESLDGKQHHIQ